MTQNNTHKDSAVENDCIYTRSNIFFCVQVLASVHDNKYECQ